MAKKYKVAIWASVFVEADNQQQAEEKGRDAVNGLKNRDFDIEVEEWGEADV